jgi:choline dehydrogenase-like flavoprotein
MGGSSAINLLVWDGAIVAELDSWEAVGNPGGNWDTHYPDMLLAENFFGNASLYGNSGTTEGGPLGIEIAEYVSPQAEAFIPVLDWLNVTYNDVSLSGNSLGSSYQTIAADGQTHRRSYSPGYLKLATPKLCVQLLTTVHKILIDDLTAKGVVLPSRQQIITTKEVILSAGSSQSPGLLELSGIGNSTVLNAAGVTPLHELHGVGINLQDHVRIQNSYQVRPGILSSDELRSNATYRTLQLALFNAS